MNRTDERSFETRAAPKEKPLTVRAAAMKLRSGDSPVTVDETARTVDYTLATENPVKIYDWERGLVDEVLLMKGMRTPPAKVPLLDAHSRWAVGDVLGSVRDIAVSGEALEGRAHFSTVEKAENAFNLVREGHLSDGSIGYAVHAYTWVKDGETSRIGGRSFKGPVKVVTDWSLREFSLTPIGADEAAKARSQHSQPQTETREDNMKKKLRQYLEAKHGLRSDATVEEAWEAFRKLSEEDQDKAMVESVRSDPAPKGGDTGTLTDEQRRAAELEARHSTDSERERIRRAETERVNEIRAMAATHGIDQTTADRWVDEGTTVADASRAALRIIAASASANGGRAIVVTADERDKFRGAATSGLLLRSGNITDRSKVTNGGEVFAGMTLRELASECLRIANQPGRSADPRDLFKRAMSSSDFPNILGDVAHKEVLVGFDAEPESFMDWVDTSGNLSDFRSHTFARVGEFPSLVEVNPDGGEYKYGKQDDKKETVQALNYGGLVKFTYEAMINDDLGELTQTERKMGAAVKRKQGDLAYAVLTANGNMGDGKALFHADHGNLASSAAALSNTTLNLMRAAMAVQKDISGIQVLNVPLVYILAPNALFATLMGLLANIAPAQASNVNVFTGLKPVFDARLDAASATAYYGASTKGKTVKLFSLGGSLAPYIEQRMGFETDGMEFKVRWAGAAKALDWAGLYKNAGA